MSELPARILDLLSARSGRTAAELADELAVEKSAVHAALYGDLKSKVTQDKGYRWHRTAGAGAEQRDITLTSPLARLSRYYLDCISRDDLGGVSVFAESRAGTLNYLEIPALPGFKAPDGSEGPPADARRLLSRANTGDKRQTLIVGYPVRINVVASRKSSWSAFKVEPLFLFSLEHAAGREPTAEQSGDAPQLNLEALKSLVGARDYTLLDEAMRLGDQLGLASSDGACPELDDLFARLQSIRPEWDWREPLNPGSLSRGEPLASLRQHGIYNRAVLIATERSPYTKGLESDLADLQAVSPTGSALHDWLADEELTATVTDERPLLEVLPLNTEQRQAVRQALVNRLTVISGPPGTGKSQVVASILINAAWQQRTVLFASKNNKAVDVVETRINALSSRPMMIRLGAGEHQTRVAEYLTALLAATSTEEERADFRELQEAHDRLLREANELDSELDAVVARRNAMDRMEQSVESVRTALGERIFQSARTLELGALRGAVADLAEAIGYATKSVQTPAVRLAWPLLKDGRYAALAVAAAAFAQTADAIGLPLPDEPVRDESIGAWSQYAIRLAVRLAELSAARSYFDGLAALTDVRSLPEISAARMDVSRRISECSGALWEAWLRLEPARLTAEDRRSLGDLSAVLRLIIAANADRRGVQRDVMRRYYELFPKVASVLPCWAVTSLSARGRIPLQAGFVDLLVIDEASQCDIASVLPLLYRAKRVVVIGDPKQLRHISRLSKASDQQLLAKHGLLGDHAAWSYSTQSVFDLAVTRCRSSDIVMLRDHHRSHPDIIEFSNRWFYEGALRVATRQDRLRRPDGATPAVRWVDVEGRTLRPTDGGAVNDTEAVAVVRELRRLVGQGYRGTMGVISPFRAQAVRIRDLVAQDDELTARLAAADFLVDTVHRFQGDERDVMLFSPTVSAGATDSALQFLRGNGNLFNVAVTRARSALVVIGDRQAVSRSGIDYLARFVEHCEAVEKGSRQTDQTTVADLGPEYPAIGRSDRVSDWERLFYRAAYARGLRLIPQFPVDKYFLDFALLIGDRRLAIEIDGEHYHRDWDGALCTRDQIRNQRLIELGWDVMRFWVYQIRDDRDRCLHRIERWIHR